MFGEWEGFFTTVAGVSVAAFSVLFVALQVKSDRWTSSRSKTWAAMAALTELLVPLIASLISLMPAHPWPIAAWITGGFGLLVIWGHLLVYQRDKSPDRFDGVQAILSVCVSTPVYGAMIAAGFVSEPVGLYMLGGLSIWLLFSGATEGWFLLEPRSISATPKRQILNYDVTRSSQQV